MQKVFGLELVDNNRQLDIHFKNLFSYFDVRNKNVRQPQDWDDHHTVSDILREVDYLLKHKHEIQESLTIRHIHALGFRVAHMIQFYGADVIASYVYINFEAMELKYG